ncbi:MAG TPA: hypothetical protein PKE26_05170 [Kiritimatiellia bacterium]|nr:hypothetical protein [Kiritimatiellia bacterium]HMO98483.1 hypothetical protein [Kiritimatiellia bacterium]
MNTFSAMIPVEVISLPRLIWSWINKPVHEWCGGADVVTITGWTLLLVVMMLYLRHKRRARRAGKR